MKNLIVSNKIEAYNLPQGILSQLCRTMASKQPGIISKVGLKTYIDPRVEGGRMNKKTKKNIVKLLKINGEEYLFYQSPKPNFAIIRGSFIDEEGYVYMEHEATTREDLSIAQAVHNNGGVVVCQFKQKKHSINLNPHLAKIPGFLIDYYVQDQIKNKLMKFFTINLDLVKKAEKPKLSKIPLDIRKVIARRAALELKKNNVVNLGVGVSVGIYQI